MLVAKFKLFIADDSGATAIEYALLAALIAIAGIVGFTAFGGGVTAIYNSIGAKTSNSFTASF